MKLILEQRYLFDGSVSAVNHHAVHADHDTLPWHVAIPPISAADGQTRPANQDPITAADATIATVLIVDPRVANWRNLVAGVKPGVDVVVLDPGRDGIAQVTQALQGLSGVKNLEFLTDGKQASITLGGSTLDLPTLTARASDITSWRASLSAHADIVLWGCNVAEGSAGAMFIADMHTLTGATVGASSDATGAAALGGNWTLEASTGPLHRDVMPITGAVLTGYTGILDTPLPTVTLAATDATSAHVAANTVLLGDAVNISMSFSNQASNAAGFEPYVELFAPASSTLSDASLGGVALTALSAPVAGSAFTNPLTGLHELAPSGITNGSAYFLTLPYGSFTPTEPAVSITARLDLAGGLTAAQSSALIGTTVAIEARGGFRYGAVATGGTPIVEAAAASASQTVELLESWMSVATLPGESETATGPDFPVTYTVHLEPAPAVATLNVPITNLAAALTLPNDIIATGVPAASASGSDVGQASIASVVASGGAEQILTIGYTRLSSTQTVSFSAFVPRDYQYTASNGAAGTPILDPASGNPVAIAIDPAYVFSADPWFTSTISGSGDVSGATFTAKSLAVQLTGTSGALPTQDVTTTLKFEVSDYFAVSGLTLGATLGDGLTFDPSVGRTPILTVTAGSRGGVSGAGLGFAINAGTETSATVNNELVNTAGSGPSTSYHFNGTTGQTAISFDAGALLSGTYGAGTTGSVVFAATVLDAYPTGTDQVPGAGGFLREADSVSTTGQGTAGSLYDGLGGSSYSASVGSISDPTDAAVDTLPQGALSLSVIAVTDGGVSYTSGPHLSTIAPGDTVVYQLVYTLAQPGDFAGASVTAYLPEPVFSVLAPGIPNTADYTTSASSTAAFTASSASATNLISGTYNFATSYAGAPGIEVSRATATEPSNSVRFDIASTAVGNPSYLNTTTGVGAARTVAIDFAVTASSLPFVNGLHLTAQGDSAYTPARAAAFTLQQAQTVFLGEPSLLNAKQGVVSIIGDNGTNINTGPGIVWTAGDSGAVTDASAASAVFAKAGTTAAAVFAAGAVVPDVQTPAVDDLNVAGAQAGDTVRLIDTVQNSGGHAAYDVIVKDALSQAFTNANVTNLNFTRGDGIALVALDPATGSSLTNVQAVNAFFSATGVLLTVGGDHTQPVLATSGTGADIAYVTYDVKLPAAAPTAASLTGQLKLVAWTNQDLYVANGSGYTLTMPGSSVDGNFADDPAVGSAAGTLTDTATVATVAPAIADTITGASDTADSGAAVPSNTFPAHGATIVPGETIALTTTIMLPQGVSGNLTAADVLPPGLTPVPGSVVATYHDAGGNVVPEPSLQAIFRGSALTLTSANWTVPENLSGDRPATIVITYQAIAPGSGSPIDAGAWTAATLANHNITLTDSFAATAEGIGYTTKTETSTSTTIAPATASGITNSVTVTNPLVTATLSDNAPGAVYSGDAITYTLTLTNDSGTAASDVGSSITLPTGLGYMAGSLMRTSGAAGGGLTGGNIGVNGVASAGEAVGGVALGAGATSTFTFQATVNDNLPAGTGLTVGVRPIWNSLPASAIFDVAHVNASTQAYDGSPGTVSNSVGVITPVLSIIGQSNNTHGGGTSFDPLTTTTATDNEIVRMRAVLQLPEGQNNAVDMRVTLPTGLAYQADGSTNVLLLSPLGDLTTTAVLAGTRPGALQRATGNTLIDLAKLNLAAGVGDPVVTSLGPSAITTSGHTVAFTLGQLTNNDILPSPNYVVVEFNAVVAAGTPGVAALRTTMHANANGLSTGMVTDTVYVIAPVVTLQKTISGIVGNPDGSVTVSYRDTERNTGDAPAYDLILDDPGAGVGAVSYSGLAASGSVTSVGSNGSHFDASISRLPVGGTQTFTYSVVIPHHAVASVTDAAATATVTSQALNPEYEAANRETLAGTSLTPPRQSAIATAGLDLISGTVDQDVGATAGSDSPLAGLAGQIITVTFPGPVAPETTATGHDGHYAVLVPDSGGPMTMTVTAVSPAGDTLDNPGAASAAVAGSAESGSNPVTLTFTPAANTSYTPVPFDFWRPLDTAPLLASVLVTPLTEQPGAPVVPFPSAAVSDAQLDGSFGHDFSGTTLIIQRYIGNTAAPDAADSFSGAGSATAGVFLSNGPGGSGNVALAGSGVGIYIETGGVLTIRFASSGITASTVGAVLNGIGYTFAPEENPLVPVVTIGAVIDDANNDPVALNGNPVDASGPHDQGPGGDMLSNVLAATIHVPHSGPASTFTEPNDAAPAAAAVSPDPNVDLANVGVTLGQPSRVAVTIANARPEDVLSSTNTAGITGTYADGILTLTPVNGHTPSLAEWQAAVRSVQYYDTSDVPHPGPRTISVALTSSANTATEQATVEVVPVDDSPILDTTVSVSLTDATELTGAGILPPHGAAGTLISQLVSAQGTGAGNVSDPDGPGLIDGAVPTAPGIAITGFNTVDKGGQPIGTWYYSINGGTSWAAFSSTISVNHPLDLASTARVAFQPAVTDFNGQIPNGITFRAWDGFDGTISGAQADLTGTTAFGQSAPRNTAATAYSIATETLPLMIDHINSAPDATGAAVLSAIGSPGTHPVGQTVVQLFGNGFSDPGNSQFNPVTNPLGSTPNSLAGVAVTGNAATHGQGTWEYSLDGGGTWTPIPTTVSQTDAVILPAAARIIFQPANGFTGHPGVLAVNLIDSSNSTIAPGVTGARLALEGSGNIPLTALANVDIPSVGGTSAFSAGTMTLDALVNPLPLVQPNAPIDPLPPMLASLSDDPPHDPGRQQFWTRADYFSQPLIPDLSLVGSVADRYIITEQYAVITVPPNIFQDSLPQAQLSYDARLPDGSPLPSWLTFNPDDLTFTGTPPRQAHGRLEILIRASDVAGNTADASFNLLIGRDHDDLVAPQRTYLPNHAADLAQGLREATAIIARAETKFAHRRPVEHPAHAVNHVLAQAALLADLPDHGVHTGDFSAALRAAGPMAAQARARVWIENLDDRVRD